MVISQVGAQLQLYAREEEGVLGAGSSPPPPGDSSPTLRSALVLDRACARGEGGPVKTTARTPGGYAGLRLRD